MPDAKEQTLPEVGWFELEVSSSGRSGRRRFSRFTLRCDAIGLHDRAILLLSVAGPETSVKALTAGLRSSARDQQRINYSVRVAGVRGNRLERCPEGYRIHRTKL